VATASNLSAQQSAGFTEAEIERARAFHRPRYVALGIDLALTLALLAALTQLSVPGPWWTAAVLAPLVVDLLVACVGLPVDWWRYRHDLRFGLTAQTARAWAADRAKGIGVIAALTVLGLAPLFALAHFFRGAWPWSAAPAAAALVLVLGFLAPVVLEPVFNRFTPLADAELSGRLLELGEQAGAPLREILVADASRQTNRQNAYVSGIGRTRRLVLSDTLLESPPAELAVVVAHELGHRVRRHLALLTVLGMAGSVAFVLILRLLRPHPVPHDAAFVLLLGLLLELAAAPAATALSRRFERTADRFSLALTSDREAFRAVHRRLGLTNLADLDPPKPLYLLLFTHPTPQERIGDA